MLLADTHIPFLLYKVNNFILYLRAFGAKRATTVALKRKGGLLTTLLNTRQSTHHRSPCFATTSPIFRLPFWLAGSR